MVRERRSNAENVAPLAYLVAALLLVVLALPTVLRTPPDVQQESAELSPDAPHDDDDAPSLVSTFTRASSGTVGEGGAARGAGDGPPAGPAAATAEPAPRACPHGFGDPPRQTRSLYSPPCATGGSATNPGSTFRGVTATEVRIAVSSQLPDAAASRDGEISDVPRNGETPNDRTFRVYQSYLNSRFQLHGRRMRLFYVNSGAGAAQQTNSATKADEVYSVFGLTGTGAELHAESTRRGLVTFGSVQNPAAYYRDNQPHAFAFKMDGTKLMQFSAETICKQLNGRTTEFTDDPALVGRPRKFGAMMARSATHGPLADDFPRQLREMCGLALDVVIEIEGGEGLAESASTAVTRLKAAGVTTLICICNPIYVTPVTYSATRQSYFPEWWVAGLSGLMENATARLYDPQQWSHAMGVTPDELAIPDEDADWYHAYKEIDPEGEPSAAVGKRYFDDLLQLAAGIQRAGPTLTPRNFQSGLVSWPRRPPSPSWAIAGGYGPGDYTFSDYVVLGWWDPDATDPAGGQTGAYRFLLDGTRLAPGDVPTSPLPWFREGVTTDPALGL